MARVSHFFENFEYNPESTLDLYITNEKADVHPARKLQKLYPWKTAGRTIKSLIMKPYHGLCALGHCYKQHLSIMFNTTTTTTTSTPSTEKLFQGHDDVEAGSTTYDLRPASDEQQRRQSARNHVDYVFGLGPDTCSINNTAATKVKPTTSMSNRTPDARTFWDQVYLSHSSSELELINDTYRAYLFSIGYYL